MSARNQRGYILLTLLLIISLIAIASGVAASAIAFEIRRDREEEMIHRGVQYSRAIRSYAKKTGHYPIDIHELIDPHGAKYIRKLYKDPITGKDFRLLHTADIMSKTDLNASRHNTSGSDNATGSDSGLSADANSGTALDAGNAINSNPNPQARVGSNGTNGTNSSATSLFSSGTSSNLPGDNPMGGVIIGVASTSKKKSIREFDHKNHYDQWLFFYDPNYDRGYPIKGPTSMSLTSASVGTPAGSIGQPGPGAAPFPGGMNSAQPAQTTPPPQ